MVLVGYSDSEGSDAESGSPQPPKSSTKPAAALPTLLVDKSNPKKIVVNLSEKSLGPEVNDRDDNNEPPLKRARVGAGAFSGFNAMLPPPKRDQSQQEKKTASLRKVFSLRTGAEPAFSRESDTELRDAQRFDQSDVAEFTIAVSSEIPEVIRKAASTKTASSDVSQGKPFLFKPLSVARGHKKKKTIGSVPAKSVAGSTAPTHAIASESNYGTTSELVEKNQLAPKKISLFSASVEHDSTPTTLDETVDEEDDIIEDSHHQDVEHSTIEPLYVLHDDPDPNSLTSIADSLNLSAAERRQLLGRNHNPSVGTASRVINFNTDTEYAANQQLNAIGEQVQHNPVRTIAPGKHSLKSLVASAQGQKDALEESFAQGRRNKRETGNKYGW